MRLVIDIDEKVYGLLKYFEGSLGLNDKKDSNDDVKTALMRAVINGTPLPKHGRLIDKDKMMADLLTVDPQYQVLIDWCLQVTEAQPTIIEGE